MQNYLFLLTLGFASLSSSLEAKTILPKQTIQNMVNIGENNEPPLPTIIQDPNEEPAWSSFAEDIEGHQAIIESIQNFNNFYTQLAESEDLSVLSDLANVLNFQEWLYEKYATVGTSVTNHVMLVNLLQNSGQELIGFPEYPDDLNGVSLFALVEGLAELYYQLVSQ